MKTIQVFILAGIGAVFSEMVSAQSLTNKPVFETDSIKVVTNEKFPQDMESEIFVGKANLYFRTEGKTNQIKKFVIDTVGSGPAISMIQKEGTTNSYVLYLFSSDADGKIFGLFDLNTDGVWDVKRTPTRKGKNFILFQSQWLAVDRIDGLLSEMPTAKSGDKKYVFQGVWKSAN